MAGIKNLFSRKKNSEITQVGPPAVTPMGGRLMGFKSDLPFEKAMPAVLLVLLALMAADLSTVFSRSYMIPSGAPPAKKLQQDMANYRPKTDYVDILSRDIFNSDGFIPEVKMAEESPQLDENTARESALPLTLVGTIVHANPGKSVATIQQKGNVEKVLPYIPNDDIEGMATLMKVERKKAFIRNLGSGALEYIQIKDDSTFAFQKKSAVSMDGPISKEGDNTFAISRGDLEQQMTNLPELLTQARAVPNLVPGGNGKIDGFRILDVVDGSLYTKLGIKNGDIIKSVDGEPVDSPAKAMELYNSLRSKNQVQITMDRNGKTSTMTYNIR